MNQTTRDFRTKPLRHCFIDQMHIHQLQNEKIWSVIPALVLWMTTPHFYSSQTLTLLHYCTWKNLLLNSSHISMIPSINAYPMAITLPVGINYPPHTYTSTSFLHNFSSSKAIYYHLLRKALFKYSYLWTPIPYLKRYNTLSCIHGSVVHTWCLHQIPQVGQVILS